MIPIIEIPESMVGRSRGKSQSSMLDMLQYAFGLMNVKKKYIERKYGIKKYTFPSHTVFLVNLKERSLNPEYVKVINNYLLQRKLRVKLPPKNIKEKVRKI